MIEKLRTLNNEESTTLLRTLTTKTLKELAAEAGITVSGGKDKIIGQIVNHFGFKRLNKKMAQRPIMQR